MSDKDLASMIAPIVAMKIADAYPQYEAFTAQVVADFKVYREGRDQETIWESLGAYLGASRPALTSPRARWGGVA